MNRPLDSELEVTFNEGTQRIRTPEETLLYIKPKLPACGITRVPDITQLDKIGIPTCCAIRPTASVLQVSNGKGASKAAAQVSALMESIELFHAEDSQPFELTFDSAQALETENDLVDHSMIQSFRGDVYYAKSMKMHWFKGVNALSQQPIYIPASAIFFNQQPAVHRPTTNGLASGNHLTEASIHALYELIERDAGSRLSSSGKINIANAGEVIDISSVTSQEIKHLVDLMGLTSKVVLCFVRSAIDVYTFWAILLNKGSLSALTTLNIGWGTHRNKDIAASRALTEAAQSRLTSIHGAREDIVAQAGYNNSNVRDSAAFRFFDQLKTTCDWNNLPEYTQASTTNLMEEWIFLLTALKAKGHSDIYQFDLTRKDIEIPVVKLIVPSLNFNEKMF